MKRLNCLIWNVNKRLPYAYDDVSESLAWGGFFYGQGYYCWDI
jgi:hypothetical protein